MGIMCDESGSAPILALGVRHSAKPCEEKSLADVNSKSSPSKQNSVDAAPPSTNGACAQAADGAAISCSGDIAMSFGAHPLCDRIRRHEASVVPREIAPTLLEQSYATILDEGSIPFADVASPAAPTELDDSDVESIQYDNRRSPYA